MKQLVNSSADCIVLTNSGVLCLATHVRSSFNAERNLNSLHAVDVVTQLD